MPDCPACHESHDGLYDLCPDCSVEAADEHYCIGCGETDFDQNKSDYCYACQCENTELTSGREYDQDDYCDLCDNDCDFWNE